MTAVAPSLSRSLAVGSPLRGQLRRFLAITGFTLFASVLVSAFLMPLAYMGATALKTETQTSTPGAPTWPAAPETFTYQGEDYPVFQVPLEGGVSTLALIEPQCD